MRPANPISLFSSSLRGGGGKNRAGRGYVRSILAILPPPVRAQFLDQAASTASVAENGVASSASRMSMQPLWVRIRERRRGRLVVCRRCGGGLKETAIAVRYPHPHRGTTTTSGGSEWLWVVAGCPISTDNRRAVWTPRSLFHTILRVNSLEANFILGWTVGEQLYFGGGWRGSIVCRLCAIPEPFRDAPTTTTTHHQLDHIITGSAHGHTVV